MKGNAEDDRWHLHKDGRWLFYGGVTAKLEHEVNEVHGFAKIARDLTGVKEEESCRERLFEQECEARRRMEALQRSMQGALELMNRPQARRLNKRLRIRSVA